MALPLAAIPVAIKGISGIAQMISGRRLMNTERPVREIPAEAQIALTLAQKRAGAQSLTERNTNLGAALAASNANRVARQSGNAAAIVGVQAQQGATMREGAVAGVRERMGNEAVFRQELANMAQQKDLNFQFNEFAPYAEKVQRGSDMFGAGAKNLFGALDQASMLGQALMRSKPVNGEALAEGITVGPARAIGIQETIDQSLPMGPFLPGGPIMNASEPLGPPAPGGIDVGELGRLLMQRRRTMGG